MKPYSLNLTQDYRFTLLLATLFHILLFATLFLSLHFSKPLFLTASAPLAVIHATAINSEALTQATPFENPKPSKPTKPKPELTKPIVIEKSPVALPIKEKKVKKEINPTPMQVKPRPQTTTTSQKKPTTTVVQQKHVEKTKHVDPKLSAKSLALAQKNVQQLLQQEVSTTVQKNQLQARNAATTTKYRHLILQSIAQQWIIPPDVDKHLETRLAVRLAPGGMVLEVTIIKGSGNPVLDRSAQTAVYKASPLPVPKESGLFNNFRQINLTVRPEGLIS